MNDVSMLDEIAAEFLDEDGWKKKTPLDAERVRAWLQSENLEIIGAAHRLLFFKGHLERVTPALCFEECFRFQKHYYERCLTELTFDDYDGQWADVGFDLNHQIVYWFQDLAVNPSVPRQYLDELKSWLKRMIVENASGNQLSSAVADHLLGWKKTAKFFADWRDDEQLSHLFG